MSYRNLKAWDKSMLMVVKVYDFCATLPADEKFVLSAQMRRAALSIPSNIAEGYGRGTKQDYARFLDISMGSLRELQTQLEVARRLKFGETKALQDELEELARIIRGLSKSLRKDTPPEGS
ncbi:MAG: four helix bundle protein [Armatimonadetes bacterium]|nr:four helix bundle protein [Armatimonadota bacterium]